MALNRGVRSKFPCPVCLVPCDELHNGTVHECRTSESMQNVYRVAEEMRTADERKEHLKAYGIRPVKVWQAIHCLLLALIPTTHARMCFGSSQIWIPIVHSHLIVCMCPILVCLETTSGKV